MSHIFSGLFLLVLLYGRRLRGEKHIRVMSSVILADVLLVVYLVVGRGVAAKITGEMSLLLYTHIALAISLIASYFWAAKVGLRLRGNPGDSAARQSMRRADRVIVPLRIAVFLTALGLAYL